MSELLPVDTAVTIRAETLLADPDACKFTVSRVVHPGGPFYFNNKERARGSPLIERLFALPGVAHVLVTGDVVTVGKESSVEWTGLKPAIGTTIRAQLLTRVPAILDTPHSANMRARSDTEVRAAVQELLDRELNRSIALHGGKISIVDVKDGTLSITMSGGCQGCAVSQVTLRQGLEVMVRSIAPEIGEIVDTTDHSLGKNPFYERTSAPNTRDMAFTKVAAG